MGTEKDPWYIEFPYTFPDITPGDISAKYETNSNTILIISESGKKAPFGTLTSYSWKVIIKNSDSKSIYESTAKKGTIKKLTLPTNILITGKKYTFEVVAQLSSKVRGIAAYTIHSPSYEITAP